MLAAIIPVAAAAKNVKESDTDLHTSQNNYAQLSDQTTQNDSEGGISTLTGSFSIDEAPVEINLPDGFMYLDANTTKGILSYWGNEESSFTDVIGMIIPENTPSVLDIERAWIISYRNIGHIQDNKASNMGFTWILNGLRNSAVSLIIPRKLFQIQSRVKPRSCSGINPWLPNLPEPNSINTKSQYDGK